MRCSSPAVMGSGTTKASVGVDDAIQVDLRVVDASALGAALLYFTGSKAHNIELRQLALGSGWTLNEYSLSDVESKEVVASETEEVIYEALDLPWITPEVREGIGEIGQAHRPEVDLHTEILEVGLHARVAQVGPGAGVVEVEGELHGGPPVGQPFRLPSHRAADRHTGGG